jgi:hypothetical protein
MQVPCAQLRIYRPLDEMPRAERDRWSTYIATGGGLTRAQALELERNDAIARLLTGRSPFARHDAALVRRAGSRTLVCPLDLELRAAVVMTAFSRTLPDELLAAFCDDPGEWERADELSSGRPPTIVDEPWAPPLSWFFAFTPSERRYHHHPEGAGARITYLTRLDQAIDRLDRSIAIADAGIDDEGDLADSLEAIASWLAAFEDTSLLELDYGRVSTLFTRDELAADDTCADLTGALAALDDGDPDAALAAFARVTERWARVDALVSAG